VAKYSYKAQSECSGQTLAIPLHHLDSVVLWPSVLVVLT